MVGVTYGFQQPIQMRFNELMTGARQDVVVKIYGEDLYKLAAYAKQVGAIAEKTPGASDVYVEQVGGLPQIVVNYHRDKIAQFGLNIADVNATIKSAFAGQSAGLVFENEKRFDLVVRLDESNRTNIDDIKSLYVSTPAGDHIPLLQLADVALKVGPNQIQRDDAKRRIVVGFNVRNSDVQTVVNSIQKSVAQRIKFEPGYYTTYGGTFKNLEEARNRLLIAVPIALLLIFVLLFFTFHSFKQAALIFTAIPLSAIGGVLALWLRDMPFSISAGVGFIALFGVAVLNGIVLIGEFNHLRQTHTTDPLEIIMHGTLNRLRPVLMTALVASLGFLPMALSGGNGAEVQKPLATVVIGGLVSATFLTLFILPILYLIFEKRNFKKPTSLVALLVGLMSTATVNAQQISLQEAIDMALKNNPKVNAAQLAVNYQQAIKSAATELPKTDITYMQGQYNSFYKNDNNITVLQALPFPTVFSAQHKLGSAQVKSAELQANATKNELILAVKKSYTQLQFLFQQQQLLLQTDSLFTQFERAATIRYTNGEATLLEKSTASLQAMEAKNQLKQVNMQLQAELVQFNTLLNSSNQSIKETTIKPELLTFTVDSMTVDGNPTLQLMKQQISVFNRARNLEINRSLPDLKVGYFNQTLIGSINQTDGIVAGSNTRFQGFMLGVNIPLWYAPHAAKIKAGNLQRGIAQKQYDEFSLIVSSEWKTALAIYKQAQINLDYYNTGALPNANLILQQAQLAYKQGEISYNEYLQAVKNATGIKHNYLMALKDYNYAVYQLQFLAGF